MKFTTDTTDLRGAAEWAAIALPTARGIEPVYTAMRVTASGNGLTLAAFDGDQAATCVTQARVDEQGTVLLPGRLFTALLAKMPAGRPLAITADDAGHVQMESASPRLSIDLMALEEDNYPMLPDLPPVAGVADGAPFAAAVADVARAVARESDSVPKEGCRGLRLEPREDSLRIVGSNGYMMGLRTVPWSQSGDMPALLLPPRVVEAAAKAVPAGSKVTLHAGPGDEADPRGMAGLSCDDRTLVTRVMVLPYPAYGKALETPLTVTADMDTAALAAAVERAQLVMEPDAGVRVELYGSSATIEASGGPNGASETIDVTCAGCGDPVAIIMNPEYLLAAVRASDQDRVRIAFAPPLSPVRFTTAGSDSVTDCYLLQPIKRDTAR
jgi:DNA polymerase III subunit beta